MYIATILQNQLFTVNHTSCPNSQLFKFAFFSINFIWIKVYSEIYGNEKVDTIAKYALATSWFHVPELLSPMDLKAYIERKIIEKWNGQFNSKSLLKCELYYNI